MIQYINDISGIEATQLEGFFVGWPSPPNQENHLKLLKGSAHIWLAIDDETNQVVGFINAISDQVLSAYIPLLEVIPSYQSKGIGGELVTKMIETLKDYYMVDLMCDDNMTAFYERFNMFSAGGMIVRNYDMQSGR